MNKAQSEGIIDYAQTESFVKAVLDIVKVVAVDPSPLQSTHVRPSHSIVSTRVFNSKLKTCLCLFSDLEVWPRIILRTQTLFYLFRLIKCLLLLCCTMPCWTVTLSHNVVVSAFILQMYASSSYQ